MVTTGGLLDSVVLSTTFVGKSKMSKQMKQVAKITKATLESQTLDTERAAFFVKSCCYDTHNDINETTSMRFEEMDSAIKEFKDEMKAQGIWNDVTIVSLSDFGRTLTSNGLV